MRKTVITFGTFDVFHVGHFNLLRRAADLGDRLVVGVSSDAFSIVKKGVSPVYSEKERLQIISALKFVSETFLEESFEKKRDYIRTANAKVFVMGDDWQGKFDNLNDMCEVVYLPRTKNIATSKIIEALSRDLK